MCNRLLHKATHKTAGKAKRWQLDGRGTESFGTLLEKVEYNIQHEYLTESRENDDVDYITQLKKEYGLD